MYDSKGGCYLAGHSYIIVRCLSALLNPRLRFQLVFRSLEVSPGATFLQADDASNTMETLRSAVKEAAEDPLVRVLVKSRGEYFLCISR